jgi:hypothetical protein
MRYADPGGLGTGRFAKFVLQILPGLRSPHIVDAPQFVIRCRLVIFMPTSGTLVCVPVGIVECDLEKRFYSINAQALAHFVGLLKSFSRLDIINVGTRH